MKQHRIKEIVRYEPFNRNRDTRITWEKDTEVFEAYHDESGARMAFGVGEIPELINVLSDLHERWSKHNDETSQVQSNASKATERSQSQNRATANSDR